MKINWSNFLFYNFRRRRKNRIVGHDVFANCRFKGKFVIIDGLCISMNGKKQHLLTSSISVKKTGETTFFLDFPIYLSGSFNYKISGLTYGFNVNCSRLVEARLK